MMREPLLNIGNDATAAGLAGATHTPSFEAITGMAAYRASSCWLQRDSRQSAELAQAHAGPAFSARCTVCAGERQFAFAAGAGGDLPLWRETLACRDCGFNARVRLALSALRQATGGDTCRLYLTEHVSRVYGWLRRQGFDAIGSEFVPELSARLRLGLSLAKLTRGREWRVRHEDATHLSLPDAGRDAVLSLDVLEHVPDFRAALREFARILRPGGHLLLTVPLDRERAHSVLRARVAADGAVTHLLPPEHHGDPMRRSGCLAFHTFGWDLLAEIEAAGFTQAAVLDAWSPPHALLGFAGLVAALRR